MSKSKRAIPQLNHPLLETHCHLDYLDPETLPNMLAMATEKGIERIITIAVSPSNLQAVRDLCQRFPQVYGTQGVHPHEAEHFTDSTLDDIRCGLDNNKMVAVGEIGLDYFYDHADRKTQRKVFEDQLQLAAKLDLPVVIHAREADEDTQAILANCAKQLGKKGVIHSFTAGIELAEFCLDIGFHLGFNGIITFNKADNVRAVLAQTPLDRILLETDAPYLTPVPYRGKENAPHYLPFIAEKIAEVKRVSCEELLPQLWANSEQVFFSGETPH